MPAKLPLPILILCWAGIAAAERPILHEDIPAPESNARRPNVPRPTPGDTPPGFGGDRDTEWKPDYSTGPDAGLKYVEIFNPAVVPFKRMSALDQIDEDFTLQNRSRARHPLTINGNTTAEDDLFWGAIDVTLAPGIDVPLPSVSPTMRIVSYETTPRTTLTFTVDDAGNFFVRGGEKVRGNHHLIFLAAADSRYFAREFSKDYTAAQTALAARRQTPSLVRKIPDNVRAVGQRAVARLGLRPGMPMDRIMTTLVAYFRDFKAGTPPPSTGNVYWDLFANQVGVCRHRAFAFVITAQVLGIPARFVENEAHAFTEVWSPDGGWARIDLGGASLDFEVKNAEGKRLHTPRQADPFRRPRSFADNYSQYGGSVRGVPRDQVETGRRSAERSAQGEPGEKSSKVQPKPAGENKNDGPTKRDISVTVGDTSTEGFRGETIDVHGIVVDDNSTGVLGLAVDVWLAEDATGEGAISLGRTATLDGGRFHGRFSIPTSAALRTYHVFASSPGNDSYNSAVSR